MNSNKGITMVSVLVYVVAMTIVVAIIATLTSFFYANVINMSNESKVSIEFSKFNAHMVEETRESRQQNNRI